MSVDLETQLRTYRHNFDSEVPPVDVPGPTGEPVVGLDSRLAVGRSVRLRPGWVVASAAALLVLIVVGGVGLISDPVANEPDPVAPENGWIAVGEGGDIWLVSLDQEPRRVIGTDNDGVDELCPAFSPDGRRLAYGRWEGESVALAVVGVDGDGRVSHPVTVEVGDGLPAPCPVWSPDGSRIAFGVALTDPNNTSISAAGSEVRIVSLSDNSVTVLQDLLATDLEWSPDGGHLAIVSGVDDVDLRGPNELGDARIFLYSVESGTMRSIDATLGAGPLTWSPDGGRIAYHTGGELRVIDIDTEHPEVLATYGGAGYGIGPVWSPDGEWILDTRCTNGVSGCGFSSQEVVLVPVGGSEDDGQTAGDVIIHSSIETADSTCRLAPRWVTFSPDGRYLLHVGEAHMNSVSAHPDICSNLTFLATIPIDLEAIRSAWMTAEGDLEMDLAATKLTDPYFSGVEGRYDPRSLVVPIQTWGIRSSD